MQRDAAKFRRLEAIMNKWKPRGGYRVTCLVCSARGRWDRLQEGDQTTKHDRVEVCLGFDLDDEGAVKGAREIKEEADKMIEALAWSGASNLRQGILMEPYAGCTWCGMPQILCESWKLKTGKSSMGLFEQTDKHICCQWEAKDLVQVFVATLKYMGHDGRDGKKDIEGKQATQAMKKEVKDAWRGGGEQRWSKKKGAISDDILKDDCEMDMIKHRGHLGRKVWWNSYECNTLCDMIVKYARH